MPTSAEGQQTGWRAPFAAAQAAWAEGDTAGYAAGMAAAVAALPEGHLTRPFAEYHAARANALLGRPGEAVRFLELAWREDIEKLMISFAQYDPAFDGVRSDEAFRAVMSAPDSMTLRVTRLAGSVYLLDGAGCKVVASVGPEGILLVDTGYGAALAAMRRALEGLGSREVTRLVLTHPHEDHWGMAAALGREAEIWAHPGTTAAMKEPYTFIEGVTLPPKPEAAWPDVEVEDETSFRFNGETVTIFGVAAHTGADIAVFFEGSGVLHLGDAYIGGEPMMFPGGADPDGFLNRLESRVASLPQSTIVLGGHDAPTRPEAVLDQIAETRACMSLVRAALASGRTEQETIASAAGRFAPQWVSYFYRLLADA